MQRKKKIHTAEPDVADREFNSVVASVVKTRVDSVEALAQLQQSDFYLAARPYLSEVDYSDRDAQLKLVDQIMDEDAKILAALAK